MIGLPDPVTDADVEEILPGIGFSPGEADRALGLGRSVDVDGVTYRFAKTGLVVAPAADATLTAEARSGRALIGWGAEPAPALTFAGCPGASDDWVVFAGGFYVTEPTCVDLTIENAAGERAELTVRIAVDVCPSS